jgi:hypothetical protein
MGAFIAKHNRCRNRHRKELLSWATLVFSQNSETTETPSGRNQENEHARSLHVFHDRRGRNRHCLSDLEHLAVSRIYTVINKKTGEIQRYVRANSLNAAIRAHAREVFEASASSTDDVYHAVQAKAFDVLDAVAPEQLTLGGGRK